jgi:hypothetical protein
VCDVERFEHSNDTHGRAAGDAVLRAIAAAAEASIRCTDVASAVNVRAVEQALRADLACPPRSSSSVESLNSQLRGLQVVHRTVSDELLLLAALAWNLTPRAEGRRKRRSPYEMLGVDLAQAERPWYDVLLDAIAA